MRDQVRPANADVSDVRATRTRLQLQDLLRSSDTPLDVYQLADATGLHITTIRFHLDRLIASGVITAQAMARSTPGRPRTVYAPRAEEPPVDSYRSLTGVLAANLGSTPDVRRRRAERAGSEWATSLVPAGEDAVNAPNRITALFSEMKFEPELGEPAMGSGEQDIRLWACPYRDVARAHPEVVCAVHLGLLRGALSRLGSSATRARLLPFVEPTLCIVRLSPEQPPNTTTPNRIGEQTTDR